MKQENPQEIHVKTVETSSNNENFKKNTKVIEEESKNLLSHKGAIDCSKHKSTHAPEAFIWNRSRISLNGDHVFF
jgi:hypothetical protein